MEDPSAWLRRCHDRVRDGTGWSPTDALDALLGLLIGAHEGPEPAAVKRARDQALDAVSRDAGATASLRRALPEAVEAAVLDAALAATPADVSRAVMAFLDADARRLTGAFHTPSTLAEALVACAEPADSDVIVDPACGTGAFLAAASRRAPRARLVGVERDPRAAVLCRLALADHAGPVHVRVGDGVALLPGLRPTLVLANPPFGLRDADGAISELAFLEAALQALPRGGRAWFVLPRSVLTNVRLAAYRDRLDRLGALRTAIDLPPQTFVHTGARLVTTAIELVRGAPPATWGGTRVASPPPTTTCPSWRAAAAPPSTSLPLPTTAPSIGPLSPTSIAPCRAPCAAPSPSAISAPMSAPAARHPAARWEMSATS